MKQNREIEICDVNIDDMIDDYVLMLQKIRIDKKISQYKLAKLTGLSHTTVMRIENFATTPSLTALLKIASALNVEITLRFVNDGDNLIDEEPNLKDDLFEESSQAKTSVPKHIISTSLDPWFKAVNRIVQVYSDISSFIQFRIEPEDYLNSVDWNLKTYVGILRHHSLHSEFVDSVESFSNSMVLVLHEYYLGQHTSAYDLFAETMNSIDVKYLYCNLSVTEKFYRARKFDGKRKFQKDDFFHIPFERRTQVSSQRYSFPGLPCLYVGSSMDVCFQELDCDRHDAAIAEIRLHRNKLCRVLDLTKIFNVRMELMNTIEQMNFLKLFPLVFLCSTEILPNKASNLKEPKFRPDYVIPQLLLEYILDRTTWDEFPIIGIKYYSVKEDFFSEWLNGNAQNLPEKVNIAIPARTDGSCGYCSMLQELFHIERIIE